LGFLWGAGFPAIEVVVAEIPPLTAAAIRYVVSGSIILGYAVITTDRVRPQTAREVVAILLIGGFMFGGFQAGLYLGTQYISGAVASVVATMSPVIAALVAVPVLGESRGRPDIAGFCLGLIGVIILIRPSTGYGSQSLTAIGVGLVFVGTILFAVGSVIVQLFDEDLPMEALQGWAMLVGATLLLSCGMLRGESLPAVSSITTVAVVSLLYITVIAGAGGYLLYFRLVRHVGATETTLVAYLEPLSATLVSTILLETTIGTETVLGFLVIGSGFTLVSRRTIRRAVDDIRSTAPNRGDQTVRGD
jgi:drug/metabolite transporter (DMT)-like permease